MYFRILIFEVFVDDRGFVYYGFSVNKHGHFSVGVPFKQFFRFVFEIAFDEFIRYLFFRQDKPCPVGVGSRAIG
jgi:hypothetical protein